MATYRRMAQFKTIDELRAHIAMLGAQIPLDDTILAAPASPLAESLRVGTFRVGNRWVIHPMEGWDAQANGAPSEHTLRRWKRFGESGAKWIWGGEAAAVRPDGRANPRQTLATPGNRGGLEQLVQALRSAHHDTFGQSATEDLWVGLQLTHSGRFCRPTSHRLEPRIAYHHPLLDEKFGIDPHEDSVVWTDEELDDLIGDYVRAAQAAADVGFQFVDIKACHGYLLHEFLSARARPGRYGGDWAGRTRLLLSLVRAVRQHVPTLDVVVRLSAFDTLPYHATPQEVGRTMSWASVEYPHGFGVDATDPTKIDLSEPLALVRQLAAEGVAAVNVSGGSPYYNPHVMRPATFPPSDGYQPPEDPLLGVARQIDVARQIKSAVPEIPIVGSGYTYLQDYLPHAAQALCRAGWVDAVGIGRMVLSYPWLPRDVLAQGRLERKLICRTFSDCTTGPRQGLISGCFPLDPYYKQLPEAIQLQQVKRGT